jgi:hypothetical protein
MGMHSVPPPASPDASRLSLPPLPLTVADRPRPTAKESFWDVPTKLPNPENAIAVALPGVVPVPWPLPPALPTVTAAPPLPPVGTPERSSLPEGVGSVRVSVPLPAHT